MTITTFSRARQTLGLLIALALCFGTSAIGAIASLQAKSFYASLTQPSWAPPGWVFGPVWTTLFALMAISAWLVWRRGGVLANKTALMLFMIQLALNALWSWLFFAWHLGGAAFIELLILWGLIAATTAYFWKADKLAGALMLPYLSWVGFAGFLNYALWQLNPNMLT